MRRPLGPEELHGPLTPALTARRLSMAAMNVAQLGLPSTFEASPQIKDYLGLWVQQAKRGQAHSLLRWVVNDIESEHDLKALQWFLEQGVGHLEERYKLPYVWKSLCSSLQDAMHHHQNDTITFPPFFYKMGHMLIEGGCSLDRVEPGLGRGEHPFRSPGMLTSVVLAFLLSFNPSLEAFDGGNALVAALMKQRPDKDGQLMRHMVEVYMAQRQAQLLEAHVATDVLPTAPRRKM